MSGALSWLPASFAAASAPASAITHLRATLASTTAASIIRRGGVPIPILTDEIGAVGMLPPAGLLAQARGLGPEVVGAGAEHALQDRPMLRLGRAAVLRCSQLETAHDFRIDPAHGQLRHELAPTSTCQQCRH